jgi:CHAD domain-containing protein
MSPEQPLADALREALGPIAEKASQSLRKAQRGDAGGVHDARAALRRLRVGLGLMGRTVFDPSKTASFARALRRIERALGPTRDDDVFIEDVDAWLVDEKPAAAHAVAPLRHTLVERRGAHARVLARRLRRDKARRALRKLSRWLSGRPRDVIAQPKNPAKAPRWLVRHFVYDEVWRSYEEILAFELRQPADFDVIHKVRGACRRLRFTLELLDGAVSGADRVIEPLRQLQDRLGRMHDDVVSIRRLERWLKTGQVSRNRAVTAYAARRARSQDRLRAEFDREWRALSGQSLRGALFRVLAGGATEGRPLRAGPAA